MILPLVKDFTELYVKAAQEFAVGSIRPLDAKLDMEEIIGDHYSRWTPETSPWGNIGSGWLPRMEDHQHYEMFLACPWLQRNVQYKTTVYQDEKGAEYIPDRQLRYAPVTGAGKVYTPAGIGSFNLAKDLPTLTSIYFDNLDLFYTMNEDDALKKSREARYHMVGRELPPFTPTQGQRSRQPAAPRQSGSLGRPLTNE